ncbi:nitrilase/cyanide hydratase and apolipoprotein n-acyltransferase [Flammeovirgaceae bacterium 311]|nr:nitrilase/cyanide hydratase and apolipoprotein n-acyltransferase [Flammeovirgaceae bacterium 311]
MQDLTITLIQTELYWHEPSANLAALEEKIWQINTETDLIVLPEMFTTGFTMDAKEHAEPMNSRTFRWMKQLAAQTGAVVTGSYIVQEGGKYFNRLIWMQPDGEYQHYDKRHLFRMANEHDHFSPGEKPIICEWKEWRICPLICYDLRFPVWSRNRVREDGNLSYDLLLYVANWPAARIDAWKILLQARAVENLCYVAGVNRVGIDGKGIDYNGYSSLINPKGEVLYQEQRRQYICTQKISASELREYRSKFPAQMDADSFTIS